MSQARTEHRFLEEEPVTSPSFWLAGRWIKYARRCGISVTKPASQKGMDRSL